MYRVENNITHQSWTVTSRDDLLSELELMDARRKPLDTRQEMTIYHLTEDGEILDEILLALPLEATIDLLLANFGQPKKQGLLSWIPNLFSRKKGKVSPEGSVTGDNMETSEEVGTDLPQTYDSEETDEVDEVIESVSLTPSASVEVDRWEEDSIFSHTSPEPEEESEVPAEVVSEERQGQTPESIPEADDEVPEYKEEVSSVVVSDLSLEQNVAMPRSAKSLSTHALQLEFEGRIQREVSLIDEQIEQLMKRKKEHLHLLSSIRQLELQ